MSARDPDRAIIGASLLVSLVSAFLARFWDVRAATLIVAALVVAWGLSLWRTSQLLALGAVLAGLSLAAGHWIFSSWWYLPMAAGVLVSALLKARRVLQRSASKKNA